MFLPWFQLSCDEEVTELASPQVTEIEDGRASFAPPVSGLLGGGGASRGRNLKLYLLGSPLR